MGGEWVRIPLGEFVTLQRGHDLPEERRRPGSVPILGSFGVTGWHDTAKVPGPGVTVGRSGASYGVVSYSDVDFWPLNTALYVTDFHENDARFAYYFLSHFDFKSFNSGSAQPSLNRNFLHPVVVEVPPGDQQRAIARILGTLDDKIELNRRMNETLEAMAQALFKSWFVDFDPVRAKAEGRDSGLPKPLADLFPDSFEDSELGEIPAGWGVGALGDAVELLRDQVNPFDEPESEFAHFSIPAFDEGQSPKSERGAEIKSLKFRVPPHSVLVSKLNPTIERVWLVGAEVDARSVCSTEFLVLMARPPFTAAYVYSLSRSRLFRQQVAELVTGTSNSHQRAQASSILGLQLVIPPADLVRALDSGLAAVLSRALETRRESRSLAMTRATLLPKLISGELRVDSAANIGYEVTR